MISYERMSPCSQVCYYCELELKGSDIFGHRNGGDKHPLHKICALNLHEIGFDYCLPCCTEAGEIIRCDPNTLHPTGQQPFRKLIQLTPFAAKPLVCLSSGGALVYKSVQLYRQLPLLDAEISIKTGFMIGYINVFGHQLTSLNSGLKMTVTACYSAAGYMLAETALREVSISKAAISTMMTLKVADHLLNSRNKLAEIASIITLIIIPIMAEFAGASSLEINKLSLEVSIILSFTAGVNALMGICELVQCITQPIVNLDFNT
jgi:hypothetical protein